MHKYKQAARRHAWSDYDDGTVNYNPFRKLHYNRKDTIDGTSNLSLHSIRRDLYNPPPSHGRDSTTILPLSPGAPSQESAHDPTLSAEEVFPSELQASKSPRLATTPFVGIQPVAAPSHTSPTHYPLHFLAKRSEIWIVEYGECNPPASGGTVNPSSYDPIPGAFEASKDIGSRSRRSSSIKDDIQLVHNAMSPSIDSKRTPKLPDPQAITENTPAAIHIKTYLTFPDANALEEELSNIKSQQRLADLRVMSDDHGLLDYVQEDWQAFCRLGTYFHFSFGRKRMDFLDWCGSPGSRGRLGIRQTQLWRPTVDKSRNVIRMAFGMVYLVPHRPISAPSDLHSDVPNLEDPNNLPRTSLQRLSVYIQLKNGQSKGVARGKIAGPTDLDLNSHVIILDTMHEEIAAEGFIAGQWPWEQLLDDADLTTQAPGDGIAFALVQMIFESVAERWSDFILFMDNYLAVLEREIYSQPANDRRSSVLWSISKQVLEAERLIKFHSLLLEDIQNHLVIVVDEPLGPEWLSPSLNEFRRLSSEIDETLKKPVANMVDLVYKSISIRDARQSLEINTSLWRLSWITFIFLPLTFLAGVFGMNVAEFHNDPPLKWYFIVAAPLMVLVLMSWLTVRRLMYKDNFKRE